MSPGRLDAAVVRRHLLALDRAVEVVRRSQGVPLATLERDLEKLWALEHGLQICAQNVLDISTHLVSAAGRDAADYAQAVDRLAELNLLPLEFVKRFRGVAGFRNVLVHGYLEVDVAIVHRLVNEELDDFVEFSRHVSSYLARQE